jgi:hypothetical protein
VACCLGVLGPQAAQAEEPPEFFTKAGVGSVAPEVKETYSAGISFIEGQKSKARIECFSGSGTGVVNGAKSTKEMKITFHQCEIKAGLPCENRGQGTKEIETNNLVGELGLISATKDGLRLKAESGSYAAEFSCGGGAIVLKVKGSVIAELTGNQAAGKTVAEAKLGSAGDVRFAQTAGFQKYTRFLGESSGQQLEAVVTEAGKEHEELNGESSVVVVKSVPANEIGETT